MLILLFDLIEVWLPWADKYLHRRIVEDGDVPARLVERRGEGKVDFLGKPDFRQGKSQILLVFRLMIGVCLWLDALFCEKRVLARSIVTTFNLIVNCFLFACIKVIDLDG